MKKFTFLSILIILFSTTSVYSQIKKGSILLGGGFNISHSEENQGSESKTYSYIISPSLGFATKDNQIIGGNLSYSHSGNNISGNPNSGVISNNYSVGAFYRRYFPFAKNFYVFGEGNVNFGFGKSEQGDPMTNEFILRSYYGGLNVYPGVTYEVGKRFHLEAALSNLFNVFYGRNEMETITPTQTTKSTSKNLGISSSLSRQNPITIGFRFVLGK